MRGRRPYRGSLRQLPRGIQSLYRRRRDAARRGLGRGVVDYVQLYVAPVSLGAGRRAAARGT